MTSEREQLELIEPYWEQQPEESSEWFRRFCRVRNQVGKRSCLAAYRAETEEKGLKGGLPRSIPGSWERSKVKFHWQQRFEAWDAYQQEKDDQIWDQRTDQLRERLWEAVELLLDKAEPMLRMPIVTQTITSSNGGEVTLTTLTATDWNQFKVPLAMVAQAANLGYKAIGDKSLAATLLSKAGFNISDPTVLVDPAGNLENQIPADLMQALGTQPITFNPPPPPVESEDYNDPNSEAEET